MSDARRSPDPTATLPPPSPRMHGDKALPPTMSHAMRDAFGVHRDAFTFLGARLEPQTWTWDEIARVATERAVALRELDVRPGERLALIVEDNAEFVLWFLAAMLAGAIAVPLQSPLPITDRDAYVEHIARMLRAAEARWLVRSARFDALGEALARQVGGLRVVPEAAFSGRASLDDLPLPTCADETCFLQFTSGSTSEPRAVQVTHANLVENIHCAQRRVGSELKRDIGVSWLPLYHDFGLIGSVLTPLLSLGRAIIIPTLVFATRPRVWLETVHAYRATMTAATNSALRLAAKRPPDLAALDLSSLQVITIGAEPIQLEVVQAFIKAFGPHGLRETAVSPCYGLAESTLAVTVPRPHSAIKARPVPRHAGAAEGDALHAVACGRVLDCHQLRVVVGEQIAGADVVGEIQVRGPSVSPGYFNNVAAPNENVTDDGWLKTGDLGFLHDDELYVCGRLKDLIIVQGRNYHPQQIEWEVGQVPGVRADCVVAFSVPGDGTERLIVVAECRHPERTQGLVEAIRSRVSVRVGLNPRDVALIHPWTLSKTSSGKLQRRKTRELYLSGKLARIAEQVPSKDRHR